MKENTFITRKSAGGTAVRPIVLLYNVYYIIYD